MALTIVYPNKHTYTDGTLAGTTTKSVDHVAGKNLGAYLKDLSIESYVGMRIRKDGGGGIRLRGSYVPNDTETIRISRYT